MRILVLGCNGQVGWELQRALAPLGEVTALGRQDREGLCGDLENPDGLRRTLRELEPNVIANAAAYTDVERAEAEPERARLVNADAATMLAAEAARLGAWLVHFSTDYVFDGSGTRPWREDDAPAPLNVYGETKRQGEQAVRARAARHLIFRTQWVYGPRGKNFIRSVLAAAAEREALEVVDDQIGAPTGAELVADVTAHAVRRVTGEGGPAGTFHLAARGETTWHGYARYVIEHARRMGWPIRVADAAVAAIASEARPGAAQRPRNCRLDASLLERTFGLSMPEWRSGVARVLAELGERMTGSGASTA